MRESVAESVLTPRPAMTSPLSFPARWSWFTRRPGLPLGDGFAVLLLLALTLIAVWPGWRQPGELAKGDIQALWLPLYSFMGERLRAGDLPAWNPHQFAGTPFAGDPNSGWGYLPAMVLFALMAPGMAVAALAVFHLVLGGLTTYVFSRVLGIGIFGSLVAGAAYEFSGFFVRARCCYALTGLGAWLPLTLLGAELALRARTWAGRVGGWGVAGLAVSQTLATWLGQGGYYGLLALGGYVTYRTLIAPVEVPRPLPARLRDLVVNGAGLLVFSFGLAAFGLLPRLEINPETNLAGGIYRGAAAGAQVTVGWPPIQVAHDVLGGYLDDPRWYVGGA
ncbi:MAG TPA: hypothetical protein VK356_00020, partial [Thermomicrobiales bacterium]|nr:hypothetical protein [Thermomicrobiales bacterium]